MQLAEVEDDTIVVISHQAERFLKTIIYKNVRLI